MDLGLFDGFIRVNANSEWNWDGSYYMLSFSDTALAFLEVETAVIEFKKDSDGIIQASASLNVALLGVPVLSAEAQVDAHGIRFTSSIGPDFLQLSGSMIFSGPVRY